jgi:hypothetical protein
MPKCPTRVGHFLFLYVANNIFVNTILLILFTTFMFKDQEDSESVAHYLRN